MTCIAVQCPHGHSEQIVKRGKTARGTQRDWCHNIMCPAGSFLLGCQQNVLRLEGHLAGEHGHNHGPVRGEHSVIVHLCPP